MFLYYKLRTTFLSYYLLAIAAYIIILSGVGSANIMFISMGGNDGTAIYEMILVTPASMTFLSAALAQLKPVYIFLVDTFYTKIRADDLLGPIFNDVIDDWPAYLVRLTDFWETNLFFVNKFKGNPVRKHQEVDAKNK